MLIRNIFSVKAECAASQMCCKPRACGVLGFIWDPVVRVKLEASRACVGNINSFCLPPFSFSSSRSIFDIVTTHPRTQVFRPAGSGLSGLGIDDDSNMEQPLLEGSSIELQEAGEVGGMGRAAGATRLGLVTGLVQTDKAAAFERVLFRATRGNMFLKLVLRQSPPISQRRTLPELALRAYLLGRGNPQEERSLGTSNAKLGVGGGHNVPFGLETSECKS